MGSLSKAALPVQRVYRTTWANRPSNPGIGDLLIATDIGISPAGVELVWNGTVWLPRGGRQSLGCLLGTFDAPLAVVSGTTSLTKFGAAGQVQINNIPDTLLNQGGLFVRAQVVVFRNGSTPGVAPPVAGAGTAVMNTRFGTSGTTADDTVGNLSFAAGSLSAASQPRIWTNGSNRIAEVGWMAEVGLQTGVTVTTWSGPFPAGDHKLTASITPTNSADGFRLVRMAAWLEA